MNWFPMGVILLVSAIRVWALKPVTADMTIRKEWKMREVPIVKRK